MLKINLDSLFSLLEADTSALLNSPETFWDHPNMVTNGRYIYVNNNSNILAVAHLDTVRDMYYPNFPAMNKTYSKASVNTCGIDDWELTSVALDDRLGVYIIMDLLPELGINVDVLLTTDEEIANSSAYEFVTEKQYNWMFQFDRHGYGTVVMYQYHTHELEKTLDAIGYDVQNGTFSDISVLDALGCSGFNFGTGYINEHTNHCRTRKSWIDVCLSLFVDFYNKTKDHKFIYDGDEYLGASSHYYPIKGGGYSKHTSYKQLTTSKVNDPIHKTGDGKYGYGTCSLCHTDLFESEENICDECYQEGYEYGVIHTDDTTKCDICEGSFAPEDLNESSICVDCVGTYGWNSDG